jgi:hypothetical protein
MGIFIAMSSCDFPDFIVGRIAPFAIAISVPKQDGAVPFRPHPQ